MSAQPKWRLIANLGDVSPVEYGGFFVYEDRSKVYEAEGELLIAPDSEDSGEPWILYRFTLACCTHVNGILSDNKFHPDHPAWFATPEAERATRPQDTTYLLDVARSCGLHEDELIAALCSTSAVERAIAYQAIGDYHGYDNLDGYPRTYTKRSQLPRRWRRYEGRR